MKQLLCFLVFTGTILSAASSFAAELELLNWQTATVSLMTPEKTPQKVEVAAEQNPQFEYVNFEVRIDGKKYTLNAEQRKRLKNYPLSTLKITNSKDEKSGLRTIIVVLQKGGDDENIKTSATMYISVNTRGISLSELGRQNRS